MRKFAIFEHTADTGIEVWGKREEELFENAAWGMLELLFDPEKVREGEKKIFKIEAEDRESLLVEWLREILYRVEGEKFLFKKLKINSLKEKELEAEGWGERYTPGKHSLRMEIKAVTYHGLRIEKTPRGFRTRIIFDI